MTIKDRFMAISAFAIKWCVFTVIFAAPFSKSAAEIGTTGAIVFWAARKLVTRRFRLTPSDLAIPLAIFVVTMIPSFFVSAFPALSVRALFTKVLKYVFFCLAVIDEIDTPEKLREVCCVALLSMALVMIDGFAQYWCGLDGLHMPGYPSFKFRWYTDDGGFFRGFPTACFPFPNDLSAWILLAIFPLASAVIFDLRGKAVRFAAAIVTAGLFYLFFLAKARSAWIAFAISVVYMAISKKKLWLILILVLVVAVPYVLKMEMAQYIFSGSSVGDRWSMWGTGGEILKRHPVIGSGLNTFFELFKALRTDQWKGLKGSYAHNCYLQMACDTGIIGLAGFAWLVLSYFLSVVKSLKRIRDPFFGPVLWGISIGVFAFLVHSAFDTNLYSLNLATLFWSAIAISQSIIRTMTRPDQCAQQRS